MKTFTILAALAAFALYASAADKAPAPKPPAERANAAGFKFFAAEAARPGNLFFSPYSMRTAFAMAFDGARGGTAAEIRKTFGFAAEPAAARAEAAELAKAAEAAAQGAEFVQANSFWAQADYKFLPAYTEALKKDYSAEARGADFKKDPEAARAAINAWTKEKTKGRIPDLFPQGALNTLTRLVLANAVYFKGAWVKAFSKENTFEADFKRHAGAPVKAQLMSFREGAPLEYGEAENLQLLRLRYKAGNGEGLAMVVALPADKAAFDKFQKSLTAERYAALRASLGKQKTKVFLPRFTFSSAFDLGGSLSKLGMPVAFTDKADFSGMDGTRKLYIQKAVHKAFVEVNEEGTEAAAATGVAMGLKSMDFDTPVFRADRPFFFFIEDVKTGLLLFIGRVEDPTKA